VVVYSGAVRQYGPDGALQWTRSTDRFCHLAVGVSLSGVVHVGVENENGESTDLQRFAADGTPLATLEHVTGQYWYSIDIDADGEIASAGAGHSYIGLSRVSAAGADLGYNEFETDSESYVENGIAAGPGGIWTSVIPLDGSSFYEGIVARTLARDGDLRRTLTRSDVIAYDLEHTSDGALAVGGEYYGSEEAPGRGWLTLFEAVGE
jgi:hypothetical protein